MKQNAVIAELSEYTHNNPADAENVKKAIEYLEACCQLFERGILSHEKVTTDQSIVLHNMSDGYAFFVGWADYAWEKDKIWWLFTFHYHYPIFPLLSRSLLIHQVGSAGSYHDLKLCQFLNLLYQIGCLCEKDELIYMTRAWDKEKF